jgi:hypothetical protein
MLHQMLYNVIKLSNVDCYLKLEGLHVYFVIYFVGIKSLIFFLDLSIIDLLQRILLSFIVPLNVIWMQSIIYPSICFVMFPLYLIHYAPQWSLVNTLPYPFPSSLNFFGGALNIYL